MKNSTAGALFVGGLALTVGVIALTKKKPTTGSSNFSGRGVRLYPSAPVSPSATVTAIQFINADGGSPVAPPSAPPVAPPVAPVAPPITPVTPPSEPPTTPPVTPPTGEGGHHGGHHKRDIINIYGGYGYPYGWYNYPLWLNPYGNEKSVYCMTEFGTLTQVDGCGALESADRCCQRKSRRGNFPSKKKKR